MHTDIRVKIPEDKGRIVRKRIKGSMYIYYESPRIKPVRAQMIGCFHVCGGAWQGNPARAQMIGCFRVCGGA